MEREREMLPEQVEFRHHVNIVRVDHHDENGSKRAVGQSCFHGCSPIGCSTAESIAD